MCMYTCYISNSSRLVVFQHFINHFISFKIFYVCPLWICLQYQFTSWKQNETKQDLLISKLYNKLFCIAGYFSFFFFPSLPLLDIIFSAVLSQEEAVTVLGNRKPLPKTKAQNYKEVGTSQQAEDLRLGATVAFPV